ncbi:MAG: TlpA family protein disulfide reductase [Niabella sp.]
MQKLLLSLVICMFTSFVFAQKDREETLTKTGDTVPAFIFEIEKGKTANINDYKGKLTLINLFATWCPPCNAELPLVQEEIWNKYKDNPKFALLVFGREEGWNTVDSFKIKKGFTFPILPDAKRGVFSKFANSSIPRNILIDESGKIIYQSIGFSPDEFNALTTIIDQHLK